MFVDDPPSPILFTESHGEAELQLGRTAICCDVNAATDRSSKSHVVARGDLDIVKIEDDRSHLRFVEQLPGVHVCIESTREERKWNIEHQHVGRMIRPDCVEVFPADGCRPLVENFSNSCFLICLLAGHSVCLQIS